MKFKNVISSFRFLLAAWLTFFALHSDGQTKGPAKLSAKPATATQGQTVSPNLTCNSYFPIKHKMSQTYLLTSAKEKTGITAAYKATYNYYQGKPRTIQGVPCLGVIRDELLEKLEIKNMDKWAELNDFFSVSRLQKQNRFYYACIEDPAPALVEVSEILKQSSKVVGSYTQVTETYKKGWIVPSDIQQEEIPEVEYNRVGSGKFNFRILTGSWYNSDPDGFLTMQWERRLPMGGMGEVYSFEHQVFWILEMRQSYAVLGKSYSNVMHTVDSIFEKKKDAANYGALVSVRHNFYAKDIGLIESDIWDTYQLTPDDPARMMNNIFNPDAGKIVRTYTHLQMLPSKDADALKLLEESINKSIADDPYVLEMALQIQQQQQQAAAEKAAIANERLEGTVNQSYLGYWVRPYPNYNSQQYAYQLNADGTYAYYENPADPNYVIKGQWKVANGLLQLKPDNEKMQTFNTAPKPYPAFSTDSLKLNGTYFKTTQTGYKELVAKMKPPHIVKAENEPLSGNINTEMVGNWKTPNNKERTTMEEYIFKPDGSGEFISVNQRSKDKTIETFNWRVNGNCIVRQMICLSGNCPRGDRFILKCLPFEFLTEQGKPALKIDYRYYFKSK